jgi:hypothetical protein
MKNYIVSSQASILLIVLFMALLVTKCQPGQNINYEIKKQESCSDPIDYYKENIKDFRFSADFREHSMEVFEGDDISLIPFLIGELQNKTIYQRDRMIKHHLPEGPYVEDITVGKRIEEALYKVILPKNSPYRFKDISFYVIDDWNEWWKQNKNKSIEEIRKESLLKEQQAREKLFPAVIINCIKNSIKTINNTKLPVEYKNDAIRDLVEIGYQSIPFLIKELNNKTIYKKDSIVYSPPMNGPYSENITVGRKVSETLYGIILPENPPYHRPKGAPLFHIEDWDKWWEANKGKTLKEIKEESLKREKDEYGKWYPGDTIPNPEKPERSVGD